VQDKAEQKDLTDRKEAILRAVVQGYISTSRPVGSGLVTADSGLDVSSATIRKELSALEDEGYLLQPHTSAGRVPTEKGYRYFVDSLMEPKELDGQKSEVISEFFERTHGELERVLRQTSSLLAGVTDYAAVVVSPPPASASVLSVQLVSLSSNVALLVVVLSNGGIERRSIELEAELAEDDIEAARIELSRMMIGTTGAVSGGPKTGNPNVDGLVRQTVSAYGSPERRPNRLYVGGASSVAGGFETAETVENVLELLEKQYVVVSLIRDLLDRGLRVAIGTETGMDDLNKCSIVVSPYVVEGEEVGSIGVLGPTRMNYPEALSAVAIVSNRLGALLTDR